MKRIAVIYILACVGCGTKTDLTPVDKCADFLKALCDRGLMCRPGLYMSKLACVVDLDGSLPCAAAGSVSATYNSCLTDVKAATCDALWPVDSTGTMVQVIPPSTCDNVILPRQQSSAAPWSTSSFGPLPLDPNATASPDLDDTDDDQ